MDLFIFPPWSPAACGRRVGLFLRGAACLYRVRSSFRPRAAAWL